MKNKYRFYNFLLDMLREKGLLYCIDFFEIPMYLRLFLRFYIAKCVITFLLCVIMLFAYGRDFYAIVNLATTSAAVMYWCYKFYYACMEKAYGKMTGRSYWHDSNQYKRGYEELIEFFIDADPGKLDPETLPQLSWKDSGGIVLGKIEDRLISYEPDRNGVCSMVFGAPGDGKTAGTIIPTCRQFGMQKNSNGKHVQMGAVMVTDLKGDIYRANKDYRRIKRFSTMDWKHSAHYDPIGNARQMAIRDRALFLESLSITLIPDDDNKDTRFFTDGARDFFTGISLYLMNKDAQIPFSTIIDRIIVGNAISWVKEIMQFGDTTAQAYTNHFYGTNEKNTSGVYSKLVSSVRIFDTDAMRFLLTADENSISPDDLEHCVDIYLQCDFNEMDLMAPIIAMVYQDFMSKMLYRTEGQKPPIAFIIDEFGQIPAMPVIEKSAALLRAYNCSLMLSCQSLAMIDKHYGISGRKALMDCFKIFAFMSISDPDTRDWASRLVGTRKVLKVNNSKQHNNSSSRSVSEAREKIMEPEAFGILPATDSVFIYYMGKYIKAEKTYYFK